LHVSYPPNPTDDYSAQEQWCRGAISNAIFQLDLSGYKSVALPTLSSMNLERFLPPTDGLMLDTALSTACMVNLEKLVFVVPEPDCGVAAYLIQELESTNNFL